MYLRDGIKYGKLRYAAFLVALMGLSALCFAGLGCATTLGYLAEDLGYVADRAQVRAEALPEDHADKPETDFYAAMVAGAGALAILADRRWFHRRGGPAPKGGG